ncbi:HIT family protein [Mycobacteroides saopaulense]|uniref:HIT family protein n=1 Tax=Mycobacteroides saopaulense TaxID=1578165 RepID=A0A1X0JDJ6_9MYCO|nr:HIT family protein [Mycobacteroides saopaulense]ORB60824.1 HIT family protein [Mycobacteroides saopaulense]
MADECLFCGIISGEVPGVRVAENADTYAFMDINPGSDGHLLVVPKRHSKDLLEIPAVDLSAVAVTAQRIAKAVVSELGADGVNLLNCCGAQAWQTEFHFHLHVIPRYANRAKDGLRLPWTPGVRGDMRAIADLGHRLATALA